MTCYFIIVNFENLFWFLKASQYAERRKQKQSSRFYWTLVHLQCCGLKSSWWGPRRRGRRSWAWWRPGWGWWICDDWWACGRTREPWEAEEIRFRGQAKTRWAWNVSASYGLVVLKIKNALPSGMGVIFSFFTRSEMTGRGPDGTSGSSSSPAVSSLSSSSSWGLGRKRQRTMKPSGCTQWCYVNCCMVVEDTFSSFSSSFLSL